MIPIRSVLAPTDLQPSSDPVLRSAAALARTVGAQLHILHVAPLGKEEAHSEYESQLATQVARCLNTSPSASGADPAVETAIVYDRPYHGILVHAATVDADLIVVGPHRGSPLGARMQGTTAERIVRSADVPCLVLNRALSLPLRHVGVAVDFSMPSRGAAVLMGEWLPQLSGASDMPTLSLVHVAPIDDATATDRLDAEVARIQNGDLGAPPIDGVRLEGVHRPGTSVPSSLAGWAADASADLLVTSTAAHRGWRRVLRGSQATVLTMESPCPVLLVPPSLWRRSPIPLSTIGVAIERAGTGKRAWKWIDQMVANATSPLQVRPLAPNAPLLQEAQDAAADLLVVHEPRMKIYERLPADLRSLLEHTPIPVVVLRDLPDTPIRKILVAVDTGDLWYEKLGWAKRLVDRFGAHVTIYHAIDLSLSGRVRREPGGEFLPGSTAWLDAGVEDQIIPAMKAWLWERVRLAGLDPDHVDVRVGVQAPWFAIATVAQKIKADLVIVAAHDQRRAGRVRLSPVARATLERGTYSTLVVVDRARRIAEWGDRAPYSTRAEPPVEHSE
ncbi:MAG TPA: universal stress protein [Salinibacter sp.]|nr:universal stress protein [Salinibacter sp.]